MNNRIEGLQVADSQARQTSPGRFQQTLAVATDALQRTVAGTLELAAPFLPATAGIAGAISPRSSVGGVGTFGAAAVGPALPGSAPSPGQGEASAMDTARALQAESQWFNVQYLNLQESLQRESRQFSAVSNAMKVKHDAAVGAIHNIR